jgi:hypothetical protein
VEWAGLEDGPALVAGCGLKGQPLPIPPSLLPAAFICLPAEALVAGKLHCCLSACRKGEPPLALAGPRPTSAVAWLLLACTPAERGFAPFFARFLWLVCAGKAQSEHWTGQRKGSRRKPLSGTARSDVARRPSLHTRADFKTSCMATLQRMHASCSL